MPLTFRLSRPGMMEAVGRGDVAPRRRREAAMGTFAEREWPPDGGRRGGTALLRRGLGP
jgi:hypothetical protein